MKIAVLGAGKLGGALARIWAQHAHEVLLIARDEQRAEALCKEFPECRVLMLSPGTTADVLVVSLPWPEVRRGLRGAGGFRGKVLLDCTNPLSTNASELTPGGTTSAAEQIQQWVPR